MVTEAVCTRVLGYFNSRREQEVIPDRNAITIVRQWAPKKRQ
jgi:hypothetical protein